MILKIKNQKSKAKDREYKNQIANSKNQTKIQNKNAKHQPNIVRLKIKNQKSNIKYQKPKVIDIRPQT